MGLAKTSAAALNLLIDIGYFPVHVNLDLLKYNIRTDYPDEVLAAAESLLSQSYDLDEVYLLCSTCIHWDTEILHELKSTRISLLEVTVRWQFFFQIKLRESSYWPVWVYICVSLSLYIYILYLSLYIYSILTIIICWYSYLECQNRFDTPEGLCHWCGWGWWGTF